MHDIKSTERQSLWDLTELMRQSNDFSAFAKEHAEEIDLSINKQNGIGWTLLHYAAASERCEFIQHFLEKGSDKTIKSDDNETAADLAARLEKKDAYKTLSGDALNEEITKQARLAFEESKNATHQRSQVSMLTRQRESANQNFFRH